MLKRKPKIKSLVGLLAVAGVAVCVGRIHSEWKLMRLTYSVERSEGSPFHNPQERAAWHQSYRRFVNLWVDRHKRDVTREILPYLQDPVKVQRARAARALGRLESAAAESELRKVMQRMKSDAKWSQSSGVPYPTLQLALGRIDAREMTGQQKLSAVAKSVGLNWNEVTRLSRKINAPVTLKEKYAAPGSPGAEIVNEMVDVLYQMGKQGEEIKPFVKQLTLSLGQQTKLQAALVSKQQEIKIILDRLSFPKGTKGSAQLLQNHLVGLGKEASDAVIRRIDHMRQHPEKYPQQLGYNMVFGLAAITADRRALPILKKFEKNSNVYIRQQAIIAKWDINSRSSFPLVP